MLGWNEPIKKELGACGENVFIGHNVMIANPKKVFLGDNVRIDPFTLITSGLKTGNFVQICAYAMLGGGNCDVILGDWTFIGYGSKLFTGSEDYSGNYGPVNDFWGTNRVWNIDIKFNNYSGVASNVVVLPGVVLPLGCTIGVNSLVHTRAKLIPYSLYYGTPLEFIKTRPVAVVTELANDPQFLKDRWKEA